MQEFARRELNGEMPFFWHRLQKCIGAEDLAAVSPIRLGHMESISHTLSVSFSVPFSLYVSLSVCLYVSLSHTPCLPVPLSPPPPLIVKITTRNPSHNWQENSSS